MKTIAYALMCCLSIGTLCAQTPEKTVKFKDKGAKAKLESKRDSTFTIISMPPSAEVFINDVKKGVTPCAIEMPTGTYRAVVKKQGYQDHAFEFIMPNGVSIKRTVNLKESKTGLAKETFTGKTEVSGPDLKEKTAKEAARTEEPRKDTTGKSSDVNDEKLPVLRKERRNLEVDESVIPDKKAYVAMEKAPEIVKHAAPVYPATAKAAKVEGRVFLQLLIDLDGRVMKADIAKTSGNPWLDEAAVDAGYQILCTPAIAPGGKPVRVWIMYPVNFSLRKE